MITQQSPMYQPDANGLTSNYLVDFNLDLEHYVPLTGMWQGAPLRARSLYVNNYNNIFTITVKNGSSEILVPALSQGYIEISKFDDLVLISEGAAKVKFSVLNYPASYGFTSRGNAPEGLSNDPYSTFVKSLAHFDNIDNSTISQDVKLDSVWVGTIKTNEKVFGFSSSFSNGTNGIYNQFTPNIPPLNGKNTFEFFYKPLKPFPYNGDCVIFNIGSSNSGWNVLGCTIVSGNITKIWVGYINTGSTIKYIDANMSISDEWHYFALSSFGGVVKLFIDDVYIDQGSMVGGELATVEISFLKAISPLNGVSGYIDEFRWARGVSRYNTEAPTPTSSFFDD